MYHALAILLHRPFVSEGHLQSIVGSSATAAFKLCGDAAYGIDAVLRSYGHHFDFSGCPYFLSYATYASGTIHARIAAQSATGSKAHVALWNCLDVLEQQQAVCHAPRASMKILMGLVKTLNVDTGRHYRVKQSRSEGLGGEGTSSELSERYTGPDADNDTPIDLDVDFDPTHLDIDAVIQSFDPAPRGSAAQNQAADSDHGAGPRPRGRSNGERDMSDTWETFGYELLNDPLFGIDALLSDDAWTV